MTRFLASLHFLLLAGVALLPTSSFAQKKAPTAAETAFAALQKEYEEALLTFRKDFDTAKTAEDKQKALKRQPTAEQFGPRFIELSRQYPDSPVALECQVWVITHPLPAGSPQAGLRTQALKSLPLDYPRDLRLGRLCTQLVYTFDTPSETYMRVVLESSKIDGVKARACASLAHTLKYRARLIRTLRDDEASLKEFQRVWGKPAVDALLKRDPVKLLAESEKLFQTVGDTYGKIPHPLFGNLAELSRWHLLSIRRPITIDKVSPNIYGEDLDGKKMTLRDFSGKVVLLDFWTTYFAPCQQALPYQRALVTRMRGKPFVLLGVNGDGDREAVKKKVKADDITWRSFYDAGGTGGPIATRWEVDTWPTLILLDHKGIIRGIYEGWPDTRSLDADINKLVKEVPKDK